MKGDDVRRWREEHSLTRPEMCKLVGPPLTVAKLAGIETGRDIRYDELSALQAAIGTANGRLKSQPQSNGTKPKTEKSDPTRWTEENPSVAARLAEVTTNLASNRAARGRKAYVYTAESRFKKVDEWGDLRKGDSIKLRAVSWQEHGKSNWEKGSFIFMAHVTNPQTGAEWIDVRGGYGGRLHNRSVTVDRVVAAPKRRKKKAI